MNTVSKNRTARMWTLPLAVLLLALAAPAVADNKAVVEAMTAVIKKDERFSETRQKMLCDAIAEKLLKAPDLAEDKAKHADEHLRVYLDELGGQYMHTYPDAHFKVVVMEFQWRLDNYVAMRAITDADRKTIANRYEMCKAVMAEYVNKHYTDTPPDIRKQLIARVDARIDDRLAAQAGNYFYPNRLYPSAKDPTKNEMRAALARYGRNPKDLAKKFTTVTEWIARAGPLTEAAEQEIIRSFLLQEELVMALGEGYHVMECCYDANASRPYRVLPRELDAARKKMVQERVEEQTRNYWRRGGAVPNKAEVEAMTAVVCEYGNLSDDRKQALCDIVSGVLLTAADLESDKAKHAAEHLRVYLDNNLLLNNTFTELHFEAVGMSLRWSLNNYVRIPAIQAADRDTLVQRLAVCKEAAATYIEETYTDTPADVRKKLVARVHGLLDGEADKLGNYFYPNLLYPARKEASAKEVRAQFAKGPQLKDNATKFAGVLETIAKENKQQGRDTTEVQVSLFVLHEAEFFTAHCMGVMKTVNCDLAKAGARYEATPKDVQEAWQAMMKERNGPKEPASQPASQPAAAE